MPGDLIFAIIMLIACIYMMLWTLYDFFNKVKDDSLAAGMAFWVIVFFAGAMICISRIMIWY